MLIWVVVAGGRIVLSFGTFIDNRMCEKGRRSETQHFLGNLTNRLILFENVSIWIKE